MPMRDGSSYVRCVLQDRQKHQVQEPALHQFQSEHFQAQAFHNQVWNIVKQPVEMVMSSLPSLVALNAHLVGLLPPLSLPLVIGHCPLVQNYIGYYQAEMAKNCTQQSLRTFAFLIDPSDTTDGIVTCYSC